MVPSSSEDIISTRAMRGQLKPLCRNYLGRNGGNVIVYVLISFHSRDVFCTLGCLFVPLGFRWFCARLIVHYLELGTMSNNNLRGITLDIGPILGIHSLTLIISWWDLIIAIFAEFSLICDN